MSMRIWKWPGHAWVQEEYYAKAMTLYSQLEQAFSFYEPEFMEITKSSIKL